MEWVCSNHLNVLKVFSWMNHFAVRTLNLSPVVVLPSTSFDVMFGINVLLRRHCQNWKLPCPGSSLKNMFVLLWWELVKIKAPPLSASRLCRRFCLLRWKLSPHCIPVIEQTSLEGFLCQYSRPLIMSISYRCIEWATADMALESVIPSLLLRGFIQAAFCHRLPCSGEIPGLCNTIDSLSV